MASSLGKSHILRRERYYAFKIQGSLLSYLTEVGTRGWTQSQLLTLLLGESLERLRRGFYR